MGRPTFNSIFSKEINAYLDYRNHSGYQESNFYSCLRKFDRFCIEQDIHNLEFSGENASKWSIKLDYESTTTHYRRVNSVKHFLKYLYDKDIDIFLLKDVKFKNTDFQPYIYSDDEIKRYFIAVDTFSYNRYRKADVIQFPILFRLLYCCGCRINETLGIRKRDVDLDEGIIKLVETKNLRERFIVLGDDLKQLMVQFSDKYFYSIPDKGYIFSNRNKRRFDGKAIYDIHRKFLHHAGIPYLGGFHGPRLHDFRHTMAVKSFKQMLDAGIDMYVALPILSTYLGHKTIYSTERYVRLTMNIYPDIEKRFSKNIDKIFRK